MNPKLLRQYTDILDEAAYQTGAQFMASRPPAAQPAGPAAGTAAATRAGQGGGAKPSAPLPSNASAPGYNTGGTPAKIGNQSFGAPAAQAAKPSAKPPATNYNSAVKSANAAFAANQAKAPQGDQTAGGKTNASFLPGAAGGAAPAISSAATTPTTPPLQTNALGIAPQANITGSPTGSAAEPTPAPQANALGIAPQANVFGSPTTSTAQAAKPSAEPTTPAAPTSTAVKGGFGQETNMKTDSDDVIAKRGPMGITLPEEELEEELAEMMRLSGLKLNEKAVSKQQQKFMGMVHAMQKGEKVKGASKELKKAAKGMSKKAAHDYAATKHKGLPQKVSESVMLEAGSPLEHIIKKFKHETKNFLAGQDLDNDLYDALYDYYSDNGEMPYGVAKARDGDPYQWISNKFADDMQMHGYGRQADMLHMPGAGHELTELARLAGLSEGSQPFRTPEIGSKLASSDVETFGNKAGRGYSLEKNKDGKWDISNQDKKDHIRSRLGKHVKPAHLPESEINECGDMATGGQEDSINVSTNMSSDGTKSINISAQGDRADALLQMLKMAGMRPHDDHDEGHEEVVVIGAPDEMMDEGSEDLHTPKLSPEQLASEVVKMLQAIPGEEDDGTFEDLNHFYSWVIESMDEDDASYYADIMDAMGEDELEQARHMVNNWLSKNSHGEEELDEYANSPEEEYETISAITRQGNDLNREKRQYADKPKLGDNPMAEEISLDEELASLLDSILVREEMTDVLKAEQPYKDEKTGKMVTPPKGATMPPADSPPATAKTTTVKK